MKIFPVKMPQFSNKRAFGQLKTDNKQIYTAVSNPLTYDAFLDAKSCKANFLPSLSLSFEGVSKKPNNFEIKDIYGLKCPCCGEKMISDKQLSTFVNRVKNKKDIALQGALSSMQEYYKPVEASIVDTIINTSKDHPDFSLKDVVMYLGQASKASLEKRQMVILSKMTNMGKALSKDTQHELIKLIADANTKIKNSTDKNHFKRNDFIEELKSIKHPNRDNSLFDDITDVASELPNSHTSEEAFFVKFARKPESEIARRLLSPSLVTTEHIKPQSENGDNSTDNYIPLCGACNSKRSSLPYLDWFKIHPEMRENLQNFINTIHPMIVNGNFKGYELYDTYVDDIIKTFARVTNGKVILQRPDGKEIDLTEPTEEEIAEKTLTKEELREKLLNEATYYYEKLAELEQTKEDLSEDEEYHLIVKYTELDKKRTEARDNKKIKSWQLTEQKRKIEVAKNRLKKAKSDELPQKKIKEAERKIQDEKAKRLLAEAAYNAAAHYEADIKAEIEPLEKLIIFPEQVQVQINETQDALSRLKDLATRLSSLEREQGNEYTVQNDIRYLENDIKIRAEKSDKEKEGIDFENPENKRAAKKYRLLKEQQNMIDSVDFGAFKKLFKGYRTSPKFILADSKAAVQQRINALAKSNIAVNWLKERDETEQLKLEKYRKEEELYDIRDRNRRYQNLRAQYNTQKQKGSPEHLTRKLESLTERKAMLDKKFGAIDIDAQIENAKQMAEYAMSKYSESFEDDQHSNASDEPLTSASS